MKIAIVGTGRMGTALAVALESVGFEIAGLSDPDQDSVQKLAGRLGKSSGKSPVTIPVGSPGSALWDDVLNVDVVFITVPDDLIASVSSRISAMAGDNSLAGKVFFHCSGALASDELSPLLSLGAATGSLHPIQTFADRENGWKKLFNIYFGFEGCNAAYECAEKIVGALKGNILKIQKDSKAVYHAAACILSNYISTLAFSASRLLEGIGIQGSEGVKAFTPLMTASIENIQMLGALNALTGPISRGDANIVARHIEGIGRIDPDFIPAYKELARITLQMTALRGGTEEWKLNVIENLLE